MQAFDLPTSFGRGQIAKNVEKVSFYCDLCLVDLSSEETMQSHRNGKKHLAKYNSFVQQQSLQVHFHHTSDPIL